MRKPESEADWIDILGPRIQTISSETASASDYCIISAVIDPDVLIPLHSHDDRETFYVLSGAVDVFLRGEWHRVETGGVLDIQGGEKHALRNGSNKEARLLLVTTMKMKHFFDEIGRPVPQAAEPLSAEQRSLLSEAAERYGYWLATPQENLEIGIVLE